MDHVESTRTSEEAGSGCQSRAEDNLGTTVTATAQFAIPGLSCTHHSGECAGGQNNAAVAAKLHTTGFTVGMCRNRFMTGGIAGLGDEVRPGAPRQIGDDRVERAVRLTLEQAPKGATHWSSRALAARTGLSQSTICRIWRAFGLRPHRSETFQLSNDPLLVESAEAMLNSIAAHGTNNMQEINDSGY